MRRARGEAMGRKKRDMPQAPKGIAPSTRTLGEPHPPKKTVPSVPKMANAGVAGAGGADTRGLPGAKSGPTSTSTRSSARNWPMSGRPGGEEVAAADHQHEGRGQPREGARRACRHHATVATAAALTVPEVVELVEVGVVGERAAEAAGQLGSLVGLGSGAVCPWAASRP